MERKAIVDRNYATVLKRGKITGDTNVVDLILDIKVETHELFMSIDKDDKFDVSELADIALCCETMAKFYSIDLESEMGKKMLFNEKRTD